MTGPVLVVQVHPLEGSYSAALLGAVVEALDTGGRANEVVRLEQGGAIDTDRLASTGHLIVVAPTWWGAMPARLLAWIQEALGPWIDGGPCVDGRPAGPADRATSPLRAVQRLTVVATHGSSRLVNRLQGEPGRQLWRRSVLPLCAPGARFEWIALHRLDRLGDAERRAFLDRVRHRI